MTVQEKITIQVILEERIKDTHNQIETLDNIIKYENSSYFKGKYEAYREVYEEMYNDLKKDLEQIKKVIYK